MKGNFDNFTDNFPLKVRNTIIFKRKKQSECSFTHFERSYAFANKMFQLRARTVSAQLPEEKKFGKKSTINVESRKFLRMSQLQFFVRIAEKFSHKLRETFTQNPWENHN